MLREAKDSGPKWARWCADVMDRGDLVTDEIVIGLIREQAEQRAKLAGSSLTAFPGPWPKRMRWANLLAHEGANLGCGDRDGSG